MPQRIVNGPGSITTIGYDGDNQRVVKHDEQGATFYFGRYIEQDPSGHFVKNYWAGNRLVARRDGAGKLTDLHQDRLGSNRLFTDSTANIVERFDYDPFGKPDNPPPRDERLWHGERADHESGLIYMNARYYDPELGRFISGDSIIPDPYRPQSLDRYAYVENDPSNHTDPSGHMKMQVELKKEQEARAGAARVRETCGIFVKCFWNTPGSFATMSWGRTKATYAGGDAMTGRYMRTEFSGGYDEDGSPRIGVWASTTTTFGWSRSGKSTVTSAPQRASIGAAKSPGTPSVEVVDAKFAFAAETSTGSTATLMESSDVVERIKNTGKMLLDLITPDRHFLRGSYLELGGAGCVVICFAAGSVDIGLFVTPVGPDDWFFGEVKGFVSLGGAFIGFTPGPTDGSLVDRN
jgi:RHS repeat-associated protein